MKITEIQIDRFRVWNDLTLPLSPAGVNLFYGPNEAGKTTLMRFLRGLLYGFDPTGIETADGSRVCPSWSGALRAVEQSQSFEIRRTSQFGNRGRVSINGFEDSAEAEHMLAEILSFTEERTFETVFAIGLQELQELATLHEDEIAEHLYGLTLGPDGQRLLDALNDTRCQQNQLFDDESQTGELLSLLRRDRQLESELKLLNDTQRNQGDVLDELQETKLEIENIKSRQLALQAQLRGHQFLKQVWQPWQHVQECAAEVESLPNVTSFPKSGIERLNEFDDEIRSLEECQSTLITEADQLDEKATTVELNPQLQEHAAEIKNLLEHAEDIEDLCTTADSLEPHVADLREWLDEMLAELGPAWSSDRLDDVDTTVQGQNRLMTAARSYQKTLSRWSRARRRYKRLSKACGHRLSAINQATKELGDRSIEQVQADLLRKIDSSEEFAELQLRETMLVQRAIAIKEQLTLLTAPNIPTWVQGVLGLFTVAGILFVVTGIVSGITTNVIAGSVYALLGTTTAGLAWALRNHVRGDLHLRKEQLLDEQRENEIRLRETHEVLAGLATPEGQVVRTSRHFPTPAEPESAAELSNVQELLGRFIELERLAEAQQEVEARRRRLSKLRNRLQDIRREVDDQRQQWCRLLRDLGFDETTDLNDALDIWQRVSRVNEQRRLWQTSLEQLQLHRRFLRSFHERIESLKDRFPVNDSEQDNPLESLHEWSERLALYERDLAEQQNLREFSRKLRDQAAEYDLNLGELKSQRAELLHEAGASTREEFEHRSECFARRRDAVELLSLAQTELEAINCLEPELAIVEEDLRNYDAQENEQCIDAHLFGLEELDNDLQQAFESLGQLKQSMVLLENDARSANLRFEQARVEEGLRRLSEEWFAVRLAGQTLETIKSNLEQAGQPPTLVVASSILEELTRGKYKRIWSPLGQQNLCVGDDRNHVFRVEQLSRGTREQLLLAIRLAMIGQLAEQGVELPLVLDDILVNFDQLRTEAAVDVLIEFADQGHQILYFTCHLHLAHLFESKGVEPIWLPSHNPPMEERRAG